ncbi:hypothetical protein ACIP02_07700 [Pseudomonas sp. NPDC089408]|uniref:hypothetical protein n=1 Tax=Pseudomonas sp. NPDC089408 TaxID=3364465 RepID=UPI0037FCB4F7
MSLTNRQRSFIARIAAKEGTLGFISALHDISPFDPYDFSWFALKPARLGNMLCHTSDSRAVTPLQLYFRYTEKGYKLYIRSRSYHRKTISRKDGYLGAFEADSDSDAELFHVDSEALSAIPLEQAINPNDWYSFNLISAITKKPISRRVRNLDTHAGKDRQSKAYTCITADGGAPLPLRMQILQTNAPYLDHPDEV